MKVRLQIADERLNPDGLTSWPSADVMPLPNGFTFVRGSVGPNIPPGAETLEKSRVSAGQPAGRRVRMAAIFNRRAHRNSARPLAEGLPDVQWAVPANAAELHSALARFATSGIDVLVIDGGDGTIRDVLSAAPDHFPNGMPTIAIVPSGKTNALAIDLGIPQNWSLDDVVAVAAANRVQRRAPIEVRRRGESQPWLRGFLFGTGAFVKATALAQDTHRIGAFRGVAVGLALAGAIAQTVFAGRNNRWRQGDRTRIELANGRGVDRSMYLVLASTLNRLPLGLKPFGRVRSGLKFLGIDAPPRHVIATAPALLSGSEASWLDRLGYHRGDFDEALIDTPSGFILDGEHYGAGSFSIRQGEALDFLVP